MSLKTDSDSLDEQHRAERRQSHRQSHRHHHQHRGSDAERRNIVSFNGQNTIPSGHINQSAELLIDGVVTDEFLENVSLNSTTQLISKNAERLSNSRRSRRWGSSELQLGVWIGDEVGGGDEVEEDKDDDQRANTWALDSQSSGGSSENNLFSGSLEQKHTGRGGLTDPAQRSRTGVRRADRSDGESGGKYHGQSGESEEDSSGGSNDTSSSDDADFSDDLNLITHLSTPPQMNRGGSSNSSST